jgi:DNA invertase Pin-like site-specific DNA recombinase
MRIPAYGYIRVSTEEQGSEGFSLEAQAAQMEHYCKLYDLDPVAIFRDFKTARNTKRPGYQAMKRMALKSGRVQAIVFLRIDRIFRNLKDFVNTRDEFEKKDIALHSITEKFDTKSAMGRCIYQIIATFAQLESDLNSERVSLIIKNKRKNGEKYGPVPYGFDAVPYTRTIHGKKKVVHMLVPNEKQAVVQRMQELRARKMTYRKIAQTLTEEGYDTPQGRKRKWIHTSVKKILKRVERDQELFAKPLPSPTRSHPHPRT